MIAAPCSSNSFFDNHICWKDPSDARMDPPATSAAPHWHPWPTIHIGLCLNFFPSQHRQASTRHPHALRPGSLALLEVTGPPDRRMPPTGDATGNTGPRTNPDGEAALEGVGRRRDLHLGRVRRGLAQLALQAVAQACEQRRAACARSGQQVSIVAVPGSARAPGGRAGPCTAPCRLRQVRRASRHHSGALRGHERCCAACAQQQRA